MKTALFHRSVPIVSQLHSLFRARDFFFHDGRVMRHVRFGVKAQIAAAVLVLAGLLLASASVTQAAERALAATGLVDASISSDAQVVQLEAKLAAMETKVATISDAAKAHALRVERRQQFIASVVSGEGDPEKLAALIQPIETAAVARSVVAPLAQVEARQDQLAQAAADQIDARYAKTTAVLKRVGMKPARFVVGAAMGGPFEAAPEREEMDEAMTEADTGFRALFKSWKKLDMLQEGAIAIPSLKPVEKLTLTSTFGVRSDPFRGTRAMHAGLDIPGPVGTPIYATADGVVARSGRFGAYGNLIEVNHGKGIQTRYGHLSRILVGSNVRVKRGQLIGHMGSTGRSTGPHLHYEVRVDGRAINPMPFLQTTDYLLAVQNKGSLTKVAQGGPSN
jgi:murein DD-endopeptidase MepM/ murein hydrolase activator NlpD